LYRLKYILRLSCARTLARKHKSTVRTFMQRLGSVFLEEFFTEEEQVFSKIHYDNEKYFYISDQNDQEYPNLINQSKRVY